MPYGNLGGKEKIMINIISRSIVSSRVSGPRKVVENLVKGLEQIDYPYVINADLTACKRIWIHDDREALREVVKLNDVFPVIGPNLYVTPRQIPTDMDLSKTLYLHPSPWVIDMWREGGFNRAPLKAWPTGIDTDEFVPYRDTKTEVVIYFKERYSEELAYIENILTNQKISYSVLHYGHYNETEYHSKLATAKYLIWLGRQESQGIALEEALSTNVPILVWDVPKLGHWQSNPEAMAVFNDQENNFTGATSAYYFDSKCGIIVRDRIDLEKSILSLENNYQTYNPRQYITENLSLAKQALDFVKLYEHFGLGVEAGQLEKPRSFKKWKNAKLPFVLYQRTKDMIYRLIK